MFPCLVQVQPGKYLLTVHAKPSARASAFAAPLTPALTEADLRIAAPPVEGQANAELLRYLGELIERGFRAMTADYADFASSSMPHSGAGGAQQPEESNTPPSATAFSDRIEVSLVRGGTSRAKTVLVMFPGTRAQLTAVLEKESRE
ncbi:hypothetical protein CGC20_1905 [Leishmania donovani]|uniref:Uncharacterized protein n=1 Tax=Leishmania donovani TaxID=5661 RepID=A0A504XZ15_LEIDO|nr:hypothetical protein CGC20_1905 [Leishmania donovani]